MHPGNGYWAYTTEPDPLLLPRQGLLAKPVRQTVAAAEPLPTLWVTDGRATAGLALGVPVEDLVEMPPLPPAPEILDLRCLVGGVGYYQVPATPGAPVPVRVQGEHLQLWVDGPEETTADWEVTIDGVVGPGTGVRVPVTAGAPITVAWTGVPPAPPGNFPNPFNPSTTIPFVVHSSGVVRVVVYDMLGQQVRELVHGQREAGRHTVVWDGRDGQGREVGNGVYFYRVERPDAAPVTRKMLLLR